MTKWLSTASATAALALAAAVMPAMCLADDAPQDDTPRGVVTELHEGLVRLAADNAAATVSERFETLAPLIRATHNLPYIAAVTIRPEWPKLSEEQRARFVDAFERLSIMTYAARFENIGPGTFRIEGTSDAGGGRVQVSAAIVRADQDDIPMDYVLQRRDGAWKIVNIIADGVSDLALKRAEYQRILNDGSIDDLIRHVLDQAAQLEQGSA
jgi:phospholipid transport system substrate-binding protein